MSWLQIKANTFFLHKVCEQKCKHIRTTRTWNFYVFKKNSTKVDYKGEACFSTINTFTELVCFFLQELSKHVISNRKINLLLMLYCLL